MNIVVGWTDCYSGNCPVATFTTDMTLIIQIIVFCLIVHLYMKIR